MTSVVTGANGAIGKAAVSLLTDAGEEVIAHDLRMPAVDSDLVQPVQGDLLDPAGHDSLRAMIPDQGLQCVIAAHGIEGAGALGAMTPEFIRAVVDVNFTCVTALLTATLPALEHAGGRFVAVSSQAGLIGEANNTAYSAAKFALIGWARELGPELARRGVGLHVLCPGCTESPLLYNAQEGFARANGATTRDEITDFIAARAAQIPIGRFAAAEETAAAAVYLGTGPGPRPRVLAATGGDVVW